MATWTSCHAGVGPYDDDMSSSGLRIARVVGVVAATVAQVDAPDVGDVVLGPVDVAEDDQLLVM